MDDERQDRPIEPRPEQDVGQRGGAASFAVQPPAEDFMTAWAKTVVRWNPIWVGFVVALGINLVLYVLTLAATFTAAAPTAGSARGILQTAGIWSAISSIIAVFVGGFLAGRLGVQQGLRSGIVQGSVVWALFVIFGMVLGLIGLGGFGSALSGMANTRGVTAGAGPAEAQQMVRSAASGMWWLFGGLVVSWIAAVVGGYLGVMSARPDSVRES